MYEGLRFEPKIEINEGSFCYEEKTGLRFIMDMNFIRFGKRNF